MNVFKTTLVSATLLSASSLLFANTATVSANANVPSNPEHEVLNNIGQDLKNVAHQTSESIEQGTDKTKAFTKDKWQDSKDKVAALKQSRADSKSDNKRTAHTAVNGKTRVNLDTPVAQAHISSESNASSTATQ